MGVLKSEAPGVPGLVYCGSYMLSFEMCLNDALGPFEVPRWGMERCQPWELNRETVITTGIRTGPSAYVESLGRNCQRVWELVETVQRVWSVFLGPQKSQPHTAHFVIDKCLSRGMSYPSVA